MKTQTEITEIAAKIAAKIAALEEYAGDLDKNILDATTPTRPQHDATSAAVFTDLASIEGVSITTLGNDCRWKMTGRQAALAIAAHAVLDSGDDEYTSENVAEIVAEIESKLIWEPLK